MGRGQTVFPLAFIQREYDEYFHILSLTYLLVAKNDGKNRKQKEISISEIIFKIGRVLLDITPYKRSYKLYLLYSIDR